MKRPFKPRFIKLSYFAWVIVPLVVWFAYGGIGLPHAIWSYSWIDEGQGMDPFAHRTYTHCRFVGPYGAFDLPAEHGRCGWVRFFKDGAN